MIDFLHLRIIDIVDIVLFGLMLYYVYKLLRGTVAINIFIGIAIIYLIWKVTEWLKMDLLSEVLGKFLGLGVIALLIVFQQEIRQFLLMLGSNKYRASQMFSEINPFSRMDRGHEKVNVEALVNAAKNLSIKKNGALIIIKRNQDLSFLKNTGDKMNIEINEPILESIFFKNSPLHDGAVVVEGNRITATRVVLPIAPEIKLPKNYGLRHLAAVSITKNTDAVALVVSEENGQISYIKNGKFVPFQTTDELIQIMKKDLGLKSM